MKKSMNDMLDKFTKVFVAIAFAMCTAVASAQEVKKPERAVLSVATYDAGGNLLRSGSAFYIDNSGTALSDYDLFKGAYSAAVIDASGKKHDVTRILGTNELYNVVKIRVDATSTPYLSIANTPAAVGSELRIIGYAKGGAVTKTSVEKASKFGGNMYYKLSVSDPLLISLPLINSQGAVVGITQKGAESSDASIYALDATIANELDVRFFNSSGSSANSIHIPYGLPTGQENANSYVYLLLKGNSDSLTVARAVGDFIEIYPASADGYSYRAQHYAANHNYQAAEADIKKALSLTKNADEIHYVFSKLIYQKVLDATSPAYPDWTLQKSLDEATEAYRIKAEPIYALQQADCYYAMKEYDKAYEKYIYICGTSMRSPEMFVYAAQAKEAGGADKNEVLALVDSALGMMPTPYPETAAPFLLKRAILLQNMGKNREAVASFNDYEKLVGKENLNENFFTLRYTNSIEAKMYQPAINDIEYLLTLNPTNCLYLSDKAYVYLVAGELDTAIAAAQQGLKTCSDDADLHKILGIAYGEKGDKVRARASLEKCQELGDATAGELLNKYK